MQHALTCSWQLVKFLHADAVHVHEEKRKETKKDYTFRRQLNEKPSITPGCPACA